MFITQYVGECLEDIFFGDDSNNVVFVIYDGKDGDPFVYHFLRGFFDKDILFDRFDIREHDIFDLGLAQEIVELVNGQGRRVCAALFCDQTAGNEADELSAVVDDREPVKVSLGHDVHGLGDFDVLRNSDGFSGHMVFNVHLALLVISLLYF